MSFNSREHSLAAGAPIRLYEFKRGVLRWLYNSSDRDITHNTQIFRSQVGGITDDGIRQTGQASADSLSITAPASLEVAQLYRGVPPSNAIDLVVYDMHYGEPEVLVAQLYEVASVNWPKLDHCTIKATPFDASLEQPGLRMTWQRGCPHAIYTPPCGVDRNAFKVAAVVQSMSGVAINSGTFAGFPDGWFSGGYIEWPIGAGEFDRRGIAAHTGQVLTLLSGTSRIVLGQSITAYPGCGQVGSICNSKFNNLPNYGGYMHLSGRSPFDGNMVF